MSDSPDVLPFPGEKRLDVATLARAKWLTTKFLQSFGLADMPDGGVGIPYYDETNFELAVKRRVALQAKAGSYWPKGVPLSAYGRWKIHETKEERYLFLVEGESDCWTLWYHDLPALGLPGSSTARTLLADHLVDIDRLYVQIEPDKGGQTFERLVLERLASARQPMSSIATNRCADPSQLLGGAV